MERKENYLRAVRFERPDYIPIAFCINDACWQAYPQEFLVEMQLTHPLLFPGYVPPDLPFTPQFARVARKDHPYTDSFGCRWETTTDGITGTVVGHPLADWNDFPAYRFPDPAICDGLEPIDWAAIRQQIAATPEDLHMAGLRHGHTFLQLCDIRGYENLILDMMDNEPRLWKLIEGLEAFNREIVRRWLDCGVDVMSYAEDLGMQIGPMLTPEHFQTYIKPSYQRLIALAKEKGVPVHMHSDGDIRTLADDLLDGGVEILNLQDLVNGIDWIKDHLTGHVCIDLDVDRQRITCFGTPEDIHALIREEVTKLGSPQGGLTMIYGLYPGIPLENVKALMDAFEAYMGYYD